MTIHANEPKLSELQAIRKSLVNDTSAEGIKKLKALDSQIARHAAAAKEDNA